MNQGHFHNAFAGAALACALAAAAHAQQPVRIGASLGMTGTYAEFGTAMTRGYQLCVKAANDKGGLLGRRLELSIVDDKSDNATAVAIYERLIAQDKVDLVFSPYSTAMTDAVAAVAEKYGKPMVAANASTPAIYKGRKFVFMMLPPAERFLEGLVDLAAKRGLKTILMIHEDTLFPKVVSAGAAEMGKKRGLQVIGPVAYPRRTTEFTALLAKYKSATPDVIAVAGYYDDAVGVTRALKELDMNPKMAAFTVGAGVPKFYEALGRAAEYVYGATPWEAALVNLRAGGLVPLSSKYPGAREFVEAYRKEYGSEDMTYQATSAYGACQLMLEAVRRVGSLDDEKIRAVIARFDAPTTFGDFKLDKEGVQVGHKMLMFQWQDGKKVIVWPEDLAAGNIRFPTPPWNKRP